MNFILHATNIYPIGLSEAHAYCFTFLFLRSIIERHVYALHVRTIDGMTKEQVSFSRMKIKKQIRALYIDCFCQIFIYTYNYGCFAIV